jgi:lipoate---protein ligase
MYIITPESANPYFNLAVEEILLKNSDEEFLILGINNPSVIIGKHQSAHREINTPYVFRNNIPVIRRISGGGTVYHDNGNLNFAFISNSEPGRQIDFRKYTEPVIGFLQSLGVNARFEGKNDIKVDGLKISGNAEHVFRNRVLHHGTLLFNASLEDLKNSIRKDYSCYSTRAVDSNPSSVMNLGEELKQFSDVLQLREAMRNYFFECRFITSEYDLSASDIEEARSLAQSKYATWEWNFAYSPEYHFNNSFLIEGKECSCSLFVKDGIIRECSFMGNDRILIISDKLIACRHMPDDLQKVFESEKISISEEDIFKLF